MNSLISDPDVQDVLSKSSSTIENLLAAAVEQEKVIESLKTANAELTKRHVVLEKVASEAPVVNAAGVDKVVDELVSSGYFSEVDGIKFAAELKKSPDNLLKLASHLIRINNPSQEGAGTPRNQSIKQASSGAADEWELDGWTDCF